MPPLRRIFTFSRISAALLTVQSLLLLQVPLLNVLGLEFSVASVPLVSLLAALAVLRRAPGPEVPQNPYRQFGAGIRSGWYILLIPGLLALANALFVRNCDPLGGTVSYLLVVPFGALVMMAMALCMSTIIPGSPRTFTVIGWVAILLHIVVVTFFGPQIFAYNPIVGYFPGLSYDSTRSVLLTLSGYRVTTLLLILAFLETARWVRSVDGSSHSGAWRDRGRVAVPWILIVAVWFSSDAFGFSSSLSRIERELGGVIRTEHFVILYPKDRLDEDEATQFGEYHEFLYHQMARTLRVSTSRSIISVYYDSPDQKSLLVGGGNTNFTKPWLWQMHLSFTDRDRVLKHELVHILAAEFGFPLVRIGLNSGFIEGLAVALERESYGMPLDRAAATILKVRGNADLSSIFSLTGFFRAHASVSYTLAGSFSRYLIERFGIRRFKQAYRTGSFNVFGRSLESLVDDWERSMSRIRLSEGELLKAGYLFDRPPSFSEECFQYKGNTLREAREARRSGDDSLAASLAQQAYFRSPSPDAAYLRGQILVGMGRMRDALDVVEDQRARGIDTTFLPFSLIYADAFWGIDSVDAARGRYDLLRSADLSDGWTETVAFRSSMLGRFPQDTLLRKAVIRSMADSARREIFRATAGAVNEPLAWYALSRWLGAVDHADELQDVLSRSRSVDDPFLRYVVARRLSGLYRAEKDYERAKAVLWEAQNDVQDEIRLRELQEGIEWNDWLKARVP